MGTTLALVMMEGDSRMAGGLQISLHLSYNIVDVWQSVIGNDRFRWVEAGALFWPNCPGSDCDGHRGLTAQNGVW